MNYGFSLSYVSISVSISAINSFLISIPAFLAPKHPAGIKKSELMPKWTEMKLIIIYEVGFYFSIPACCSCGLLADSFNFRLFLIWFLKLDWMSSIKIHQSINKPELNWMQQPASQQQLQSRLYKSDISWFVVEDWLAEFIAPNHPSAKSIQQIKLECRINQTYLAFLLLSQFIHQLS